MPQSRTSARSLLRFDRATVRFVLVGGANFLLDFGILAGLLALGMHAVVANWISTGIAFVVSFVANRRYTFRSDGPVRGEVVRFTIVTLAGLWILQPVMLWLVTWMIGRTLDDDAGVLVAKVCAVAVTTVWNYVLYRRFVFRGAPAAGSTESRPDWSAGANQAPVAPTTATVVLREQRPLLHGAGDVPTTGPVSLQR